ncbi:hypothetical protein [Methylobacterium gregans]
MTQKLDAGGRCERADERRERNEPEIMISRDASDDLEHAHHSESTIRL